MVDYYWSTGTAFFNNDLHTLKYNSIYSPIVVLSNFVTEV